MSERWVPLDLTDCDPSPFAQFATWFDAAREVVREREAITLVTASRDAKPSARMVLLRHVDDATFGWFTNYDSRKGRELAQNPYAALLWYCEPLGRQIRIEGEVAKMSAGDSDRYFASRPRGHQIGAHASAQSATLETRAQLEGRVAPAACKAGIGIAAAILGAFRNNRRRVPQKGSRATRAVVDGVLVAQLITVDNREIDR